MEDEEEMEEGEVYEEETKISEENGLIPFELKGSMRSLRPSLQSICSTI